MLGEGIAILNMLVRDVFLEKVRLSTVLKKEREAWRTEGRAFHPTRTASIKALR